MDTPLSASPATVQARLRFERQAIDTLDNALGPTDAPDYTCPITGRTGHPRSLGPVASAPTVSRLIATPPRSGG